MSLTVPIYGFGGGGGGSELNFDVKDFRTEAELLASAGKENRIGVVTSVTFKGLNYDIIVDFRGFKWLIQTTDFHGVGTTIGIRLNHEDIHIMHKSD